MAAVAGCYVGATTKVVRIARRAKGGEPATGEDLLRLLECILSARASREIQPDPIGSASQTPGPFMPTTPPSPALIQLLRSTLQRLEESSGLDPDDPKLVEFKNSILRAIAELEVQRSNAA